MDITFDYETRRRIREHVARGDADFFARHPETRARLRLTVPHEAEMSIDSDYVLILYVGPGLFARIPLSLIRPSFAREERAA